jgi:hypothetical protein
MKNYTAIKETPISNTIVKELNAAVLTSTFKSKEGKHLADLYSFKHNPLFKNNPDQIVANGTCAPVCGNFVETIIINF